MIRRRDTGGHGRPVAQVRLNHPTSLPVYPKVDHYRRHPMEGPTMVLMSGGSGARGLAQTLIQYTHNSTHVLPMFDDGGSSRVLREHFKMPPPGDLRNRLMALSDMSQRGNPEVGRLFRTRLKESGTPQQLQAELDTYLSESHPRMELIEPRYRRIIIKHLQRFNEHKLPSFDLRNGNIGNFVIAGAYLTLGDLESVIFEFSALAAVRGEVLPVCSGANYHLKAEFQNGSEMIGQSQITSTPHPPIKRLAIVERDQAGEWCEVRPALNPLVSRAVEDAQLIACTMGSFYTSLLPILLVDGMGAAVRRSSRPKVLVANLVRDEETMSMTVSKMVSEVCRALRTSDDQPGRVSDYLHYVLVNEHGSSDADGHVPVDVDRVRDVGVEPIALPLERAPGVHDPELVAAALLSLC
ncbi:MAG: YvcK family protein [Myxococcales bacterium]|nr:YvcK family protein [Myxococcales bacterium]